MALLFLVLLFEPTATAQSTASYRIDQAATRVGFSVTHMGILEVVGTFTEVDGSVSFSSEFDTLSAVVIVHSSSIDTGNRLRDRSLRSEDYLDVESWPEIRFQSLRTISGNSSDGTREVVGKLTIHGVTKQVSVPYELTVSGEDLKTLTINSDLVIRRHDFSLDFGRAMDSLVGEEVRIHIYLVAVLET